MSHGQVLSTVNVFADKEINEIVDELADALVDEIGEIKNSRNELNQKVSEYCIRFDLFFL